MTIQTKDAFEIVEQIEKKQVRISTTFTMEKKLLSHKLLEEAGVTLQKEVFSSPSILFIHPSNLEFLLSTLAYKMGLPNAKVSQFDNANFCCQWKNLMIYTTEAIKPTNIFVFHYNNLGVEYIEKEDSKEKDRHFELILNKDKINTISCAVSIDFSAS